MACSKTGTFMNHCAECQGNTHRRHFSDSKEYACQSSRCAKSTRKGLSFLPILQPALLEKWEQGQVASSFDVSGGFGRALPEIMLPDPVALTSESLVRDSKRDRER